MSESSDNKTKSRAGRWIVVALLAVGILGGIASSSYWKGVVQRTWPNEGIGQANTWDRQKAKQELERVGERYVETRDAKLLRPILEDARDLVTRYPQYAEAHKLYGQILSDDSRFRDALEEFESALRLGLSAETDQAEVHMLAGNLSLMLEQVDRAERHFAAALKIKPNSARYRLHMAQVHIQKQQYDPARTLLLESLAIDSSQYEAHSALSDLYARQGNLAMALTQVQKAIDGTPISERERRDVYLRKKASLLRRDNKPEESIQTLRTLSLEARFEPDVVEEVAVSWAMVGLPSRAAEAYESALDKLPTDWRLAAGAARWRIKAGDKPAAQRHIDTIRRINAGLPVIRELQELVGG